MNKLILATVAFISLIGFVPGNVSNQVALDHLPSFDLPDAASNSHVFSLGESIDPATGKVVEGMAIIHRKDNPAKPDNPGGGNGGGKDKPDRNTSSCYEFMAKGAKWKFAEPWLINPTNSDGLSEQDIYNVFDQSVTKWEAAASYDILGSGSTTTDALVADMISPDNKNEVYFASIDDPGVIGVTIVWGIFGGRPGGRELVEWDQIYDNVDYSWSMSGEPGKMDLENIATHELGHTMGLADLYTAECDQETMYGYADLSETYKRDIFDGDIAGIISLYR